MRGLTRSQIATAFESAPINEVDRVEVNNWCAKKWPESGRVQNALVKELVAGNISPIVYWGEILTRVCQRADGREVSPVGEMVSYASKGLNIDHPFGVENQFIDDLIRLGVISEDAR